MKRYAKTALWITFGLLLRTYDCQSFDTDVRDLFLDVFRLFIGQTRKV